MNTAFVWIGSTRDRKSAEAKSAGLTTGNLVVVAYDLDYSAKAPFYTLDSAG